MQCKIARMCQYHQVWLLELSAVNQSYHCANGKTCVQFVFQELICSENVYIIKLKLISAATQATSRNGGT